MIEELKPYADYRATGLYWLPQVPSHWAVMRSKHVFAERTELARAGDVQLSATQAYGVIPQAEFERRVGRRVVRISMHLDKRSHVEKGDFVISMRSFQGGLERAWASGAIRSSYVVLRPARELDLGYFTHLFKAQPYIKALQATGNFIRDGQDLTFGNFSRVDLPFPPRDEQIAIGQFLDHANRRIDQFIRAKKKLIELLNEQKQAIIQRAVTRGLDPSVKLKNSGVPWLGEIPAHWEIVPLKRIARFKGGVGFPIEHQGRIDKALPFIKVSDMTLSGNDRFMVRSKNSVSRETARSLGAFVFPKDSIIFPKVGGAMLTNKRRILSKPSCIDNNMMGCVVTRGYVPYVFLLLEQLDFGRLSKPGPVPAIGEGEVREVKVAVPPEEEQVRLAGVVESETAGIKATIARTEHELDLMREYRMRLISDVVTGQLDVRAAAASLPDVESEAAPFDSTDENETDIEEGEAA